MQFLIRREVFSIYLSTTKKIKIILLREELVEINQQTFRSILEIMETYMEVLTFVEYIKKALSS